MKGATIKETRTITYELEVTIAASRESVWRSLTEEIDAWWLPDFHMVGPGSKLTFDARAGGQLIEHKEDGGSLMWFTVHMCTPGEVLYVIGNLAPDWGGPSTGMMKFALEEGDDGCVLRMTDSQFGHVDEKNIESMRDGWTQLFTDGLKKHVEK